MFEHISRNLFRSPQGAVFYASRRNFYLILACFAVVAVALVLFATRLGAGLSDDSYYYVKPARNILAGLPPDFSPHFPPLLPIAATLLGLLRIEPLLGIRLLNAACFGLNVFLAGLIVERLTASRGAGLAGALVALTSQVMLEVHSWAMSEALFITLMFATILALDTYRVTRKTAWVITGTILAGCAALTRYAGIGVIGCGAVLLLLIPGDSWKRRIRNAAGFGIVSGMMFAAYSVGYVAAMDELGSSGGIRFAALGQGEIREAFYNILLWLMPGRLARGREILVMAGVVVAVVLLICLYVAFGRRAFRGNWKTIREQPLFLMLALLAAANLFILYQAHISPTFVSPFDTRLLSPTLSVMILLVTGLLGLVWKENGAVMRWRLAIILVWTIFLYVPRSAQLVISMREHGAGFAAPYWQDLDSKDFFIRHQKDEVITTAPMGVYFALGIEVKGMGLSPDELREDLRKTNGYLVVFNSMPLGNYGYSTAAFLEGMTPVEKFDECVVYQVSP